MDPNEALIEEIRKEEFGIDVILSEDGQKLMEKQKQRLGRSLDRLSKVKPETYLQDFARIANIFMNPLLDNHLW